jgi:nicotinate-nucleotide adenylyltransferase
MEFDEVMFIPAGRNPTKGKPWASAKDRLEMTRLLVNDEPNFSVSDIELVRGGPSYMVETLMELTYARPAEYWLILGSDALKGFTEWKSPERIVKMVRLAVAGRGHRSAAEALLGSPHWLQEAVDWFEMTPNPVSSSAIREKYFRRQPVTNELTKPVLNYIKERKLYGEG